MTGSQGRARSGRSAWLSTALAASGLFLVPGARTAPASASASHIDHDGKSHDEATKPGSAAHPAGATSTAPASPDKALQQSYLKFLADWQEDHPMRPPATVTPTVAPAPVKLGPAVQLLDATPAMTATVAGAGTGEHAGSIAPPPPPAPTCDGPMKPHANPLVPPSPQSLQAATAAPEPSTILSAFALIGAVAWRRRGRAGAK